MRRALTLLELLVVLAIIAILIGFYKAVLSISQVSEQAAALAGAATPTLSSIDAALARRDPLPLGAPCPLPAHVAPSSTVLIRWRGDETFHFESE